MKIDASALTNFAFELKAHIAKQPTLAKNIVKKTAKDIEATAKTLAPVDTGFLRGSIKTSDLRTVSKDNPSAEVRTSANYATYLEFGTSRMAARPFMSPAAAKHEPAFLAAMQQLISKI
ncbi:HK97-gp10 family putative phage morphogenesis protein [Glutamicibacter protophormiae]|uniref:HK97-gp10 family putative phage morphogenesis protein n=1 Tax=Glutamicibacter protophormiae TaxID=37930 RepID=UPI003A916301